MHTGVKELLQLFSRGARSEASHIQPSFLASLSPDRGQWVSGGLFRTRRARYHRRTALDPLEAVPKASCLDLGLGGNLFGS